MIADVKLMKGALISLSVSPLSILLTFWGDYNGKVLNVIIAYLVGVLFWAGLISGCAMLFVVNKHRKADKSFRSKKKLPGVISFFSNQHAMLADVFMAISFVLLLVFLFVPWFNQGVTVVLIAVFLFAFNMHCVLNGMNFKYIQYMKKKESRT
ncbi:MAG: hypothetical protein IJO20_08030 [Ruminococcus sp.]|nr:hypothetical protein [Ruminococcus sp.]